MNMLNVLSSLRLQSLTCLCRSITPNIRATQNQTFVPSRPYCSDNKDYEINPYFINRNPRNMERMGLAWKRGGWKFQSPRKDFYNKLNFKVTKQHTIGTVEHCSGKTVVSASTTEWAIRQHLNSYTDVAAALNIGRVLAQRCLECGLTNVFYEEIPEHAENKKAEAFLGAIKEEIILEEPDYIEPYYEPGIDYDKQNRYAERKVLKEDYQIE